MVGVARLLLATVPLVFVVSCGGPAFSPGGSTEDGGGSQSGSSSGAAGDSGSRPEGGQGDAAAEASPPPAEAGAAGTYCGPNLMCTGTGGQQGTVCCVSSGSATAYQCAGVSCGCATQLDCSSDAECGGLRCCMRNETDTGCMTGHWVGRCAADCVGGSHMCVPGAGPGQCLATQGCSMDTTSVGLPSQSGFGICK